MLESCVKETASPDEMFTAIIHREPIMDPEFKEIVFCVNKKISIQKEDGTIDHKIMGKYLTEMVPDSKVRMKASSECLVNSDSPQETAFNLMNSLKGYIEYKHI